MSHVFISYASSTAKEAQAVAAALRSLGHEVWLDDQIPAHRAYADVIEERLREAEAVVVIWSAEAVKSQWVQSEADKARHDSKLVQLRIDGAALPMPFDRIQCADLTGWTGDPDAPGWRKVTASVADLVSESREGDSGPVGPHTEDQAPALPSKPSIAVMPFVNQSADADQEYFADGMMEEIVTSLTHFKSIFVIASSSTLLFKGAVVSPQKVARDLGVRYILEGKVRKATGRVRISLDLIDGAKGAQIWSDQFQDSLEAVFELQDRVARAVAGAIAPMLLREEIQRAFRQHTDNPSSYENYLLARHVLRQPGRESHLTALGLLDRALALDPDYASALATQAECLRRIVNYGWSEDPDGDRRRAVELARTALAAGSDDAEVLVLCAIVLANLGSDRGAALGLVDRAIALNPGSGQVWMASGVLLLGSGEVDRAVEHIETGARLDPGGASQLSAAHLLARAHFIRGRFADALAFESKYVQLVESPTGLASLAALRGLLGQISAAREAVQRFRAVCEIPIEDYGARMFSDPDLRRRFLVGIAAATREG